MSREYPHLSGEQEEDPPPDLPGVDDAVADEAPFEPEDDSDLGLLPDSGERLTERELSDILGDAEGSQIADEDAEEVLAEGDMEPVGDLFGMEPELLEGEDADWSDTAEDGHSVGGLDEDILPDDAALGSHDDGEEGFAGDDEALDGLSDALPPLDQADCDEPLDEQVTGLEGDEEEAVEAERPERSTPLTWLEIWPGVRWAMLPDSAWEAAVVPLAGGGDDLRLAADEHGLYVWANGGLARHSLRAAERRSATGLPAAPASLCAGAGALWAATTTAVFRSRDAGGSFERVCETPQRGVPRLAMVEPGVPSLLQNEHLYRFDSTQGCFVSASPVLPATIWATDGAGAVVVGQHRGPLLRSADAGAHWSELALAVDGVSDLWVCGDVAVVATAQGVLASHSGDWLQLLPPSATVCAVVGEPRVPRLYACLAYPDGWVLVRRPCDDASWRPRIVTRLDPVVGAPIFLSARHEHGATRLYLVGEGGIAKILVKDV